MLISSEMNAAMNEEIGVELQASHLYLSMASYIDDLALRKFAELLFKQSEEEREHALKFVHYINDAGGKVEIPTVPAPKNDFQTVEEVVRTALEWEIDITNRLKGIMTLAEQQKDYIAREFLDWFMKEQLEEFKKFDDMLKIVRQSGERNMIMIEAYLSHL